MPGRVFAAHLFAIALIFLTHSIVSLVVPSFASESLSKAARIFDMTEENSIPNFFSALVLVVTAGVAAVITFLHRRDGSSLWISWCLAALAIAFMGFDEGAMLHDRLAYVVQENAETTGVFYIGWTLPYLLLVLVAVPAGWPLLRALPRDTAVRLIQAATLFLIGALGMEMLESMLLQRSLPAGMSLRDAMTSESISANAAAMINAMEFIEETSEMVAVALALRALLLHLTDDLGFGGVTVSRVAATEPTLYELPPVASVARN
ncbi:MAG: hypothetical protein AVDCRST_MAG91-1029 [uncultured Sphingomonadaceae bacterium]|uniref:Uncharacterized protein n=1 Tax=uncultured Sphingomonadaceae bacterium TaxID=169976 RepID=A0A6J4SMJ9_9SPHN|nr:MAG: hypothetical protein AVDCRST_MAG91-1029 [uncultured Sphingomonadaceae bacterium]